MKKEPLFVHHSMTREEIQACLNVACTVGMLNEHICFPLVRDSKLPQVEDVEEQLKKYPPFPEGTTNSSHSAKPWDGCRTPGLKLENLFRSDRILKDTDYDGLSDETNFSILLPEAPDSSVVKAVIDFVARIAMDTTSIDSNLLGDTTTPGNWIVFENTGTPGIRWEETTERIILHVSGSGVDLEEFISTFCNQFDGDFWFSIEETTGKMNRIFNGISRDGQRLYAKTFGKDSINVIDGPNGVEGIHCVDRREVKEVLHTSKTFLSETEVLKQWIQAQGLDPKGSWHMEAAISKARSVRESLKTSIQESYPNATIEILNAYKPGFSWVEESCLKPLQEAQVDTVELYFRPYLKPGETVWKDENGAVPKRGDMSNEKKGWMELPIRFLQELYPIDDILSEQIGISRDSIHFVAMDSSWSGDDTYVLRGYSKGNLMVERSYTCHTYEREYLSSYPGSGLVHPECAYAHITNADQTIASIEFPTDRDQIWNSFQEETLPSIRDRLKQVYGTNISRKDQPFFQKLKLSIQISETDRALTCRQDRIAPLDALQEDLYFTALEYFKHLGNELCGVAFDAPGLIEPEIHLIEGDPVYEVSWQETIEKVPCRIENGTRIPYHDPNHKISVSLEEVQFQQGELVYHYSIPGCDALSVEFCKMLQTGEISSEFLCTSIRFLKLEKQAIIPIPHQTMPSDVSLEEIDFHEEEVIGYDLCQTMLQQLARVKGIRVIDLAESYESRSVQGIVFEEPQEGYTSRTKRITNRPSVILDCRHHANEVSSTNSAFQVVKKLLCDKDLQNIPSKMNLVLIPMENPDGAHEHEVLSSEFPTNKLHVARYNALGNEFAHEMFKEDTIHTEARAIFRLFRESLPDLVIDDHGVPSHEWEQPYSGYTSPSFKGFWLPRSILYGYFWQTTEVEYQDNQRLCEAIADAVADGMEQHSDLMQWNQEWEDRFEKYAHHWMPKLFPADYYRGMINYWIPKAQSFSNLYLSQRYPWITTTYYTSEVADETAQGAYLKVCAATHECEDFAILKLMRNARMAYNTRYVKSVEGIHITVCRQRPILPPAKP